MKEIITAIKTFIGFSILLGLVYPLSITGIAQATMKDKANGSLIKVNGEVVGSSLIGQKFDKPEYFNSRPSAVDYNASGSGASNFGPSSKKLVAQVKARISEEDKRRRGVEAWKNSYASTHPRFYSSIPADMVLSSASGLDPHISVKNAEFQISRISKLRGISETKLNEIVKNIVKMA